MFTFDRDNLRSYLVDNFNNTENDYTKQRVKAFVIAYDYLPDLQKDKLCGALNKKLADAVGTAFENAMKDIVNDIDLNIQK